MEIAAWVLVKARTLRRLPKYSNELEEEMAPRLAAHQDAIRLDPALYARIARLHEQLDRLAPDPEARYLVERYRTEFVLAGAALQPAEKDELRALNERLSELTTRFDANLVADSIRLLVNMWRPQMHIPGGARQDQVAVL